MQATDDGPHRDRDRLRDEIGQAIQQVRRSARRYRRVSTALLLIGMICGAASTVLAGDAFRGGRLAAGTAEATTGRTPADLPRGWRNVCGIIAVLTLAGTLATGTNSVLKLADHQARTSACLGALAALQEALVQGDVGQQNLEKTRAGLSMIRLSYDEYFP
jgi:uncharacterized membrane protein YoaK (UPF0700 family)